jgi:hypothetical protein
MGMDLLSFGSFYPTRTAGCLRIACRSPTRLACPLQSFMSRLEPPGDDASLDEDGGHRSVKLTCPEGSAHRASLQEARDAYRGHAWHEAFDLLRRADSETPLSPQDLGLLAESAWFCW